MSHSDNLFFSHCRVPVSVARFPLKDAQNVASATSYLRDTDLGIETKGYQKKCLQHKFSSKSRERLHFLFYSNRPIMLRIVFIALAFLSGAAALSHELLWTRRLIDLLGATEAVTGRVLGLFFLGLSLGGWLATRWCRADGNSGIRLGVAELSIAVLSLPVIFLPYWADSLILTFGIDWLVSWQGSLLKLVVAAAVVVPPAIAMGTTMPMFIRAITDSGGTVSGSGIWIYSINMIGGVFGLWLVSTILLELVGVQGAMFCVAGANVAVAISAFVLSGKLTQSRHKLEENPDASPAEEKEAKQWKVATIFGFAFISGVIVLASEVLILRLLNLVAPSSLQSTSALLANVIFFLALGSIAVAILNRLKVSHKLQMTVGLLGAGLFCAICPLILYAITNQMVSLRYLAALNGDTIGSLTSYWLYLFVIVALSSGGAMFFYGITFPSIMSIHSAIDVEGRSVGLLLAINGVGGLLGAEAANLFLVTQIGIYRGFVIVAVLTVLVGIAICLIEKHRAVIAVIIAGTACAASICYLPYSNLKYLSPHTKKKFTILETRFGRDGVLMVAELETKSRSLLMNGQYLLGSSGTVPTERRQLLLPWVLNQQAKDVCCIGFATGISASGLEKIKDPPSVTAVELSSSVAEVAKEYFAKNNGTFFERSANQLVIEDGRTFIACADNDFDLIVADLFRPFGAGESRLFSLEHFRNVKRAMRDGGLFCQWLPAHQLSESQFEIIAATFQKVFPNALVVTCNTSTRTPIIGLCAWQDDRKWSAKKMVDEFQVYRKNYARIDTVLANLQLMVIGTLKENVFESAPINTLDNAILEIEAGRFWITKDLRKSPLTDNFENGFLSDKLWVDFVARLINNTTPVLDPIHRPQLHEKAKQTFFKEHPRNAKPAPSKADQK